MTFDLDLWPFDIWRFPYYINKPRLVQIGLQLFKWGHFHIFSVSYNLTSDDLWPWYMTVDRMNIWKFPYYINKPSLVPIRLQLFNWGQFYIFSISYNLTSYDPWPWYVTFDLINKWGYLYFIHKPSSVTIGLQLFNWGQFFIFNLFYNLTSYNLWPWYVTFDLINKWGFPCCTYDSTSLVEIHQSMRKWHANVNPFSQQTTTTTSTDNNNRQQWTKLCLSC